MGTGSDYSQAEERRQLQGGDSSSLQRIKDVEFHCSISRRRRSLCRWQEVVPLVNGRSRLSVETLGARVVEVSRDCNVRPSDRFVGIFSSFPSSRPGMTGSLGSESDLDLGVSGLVPSPASASGSTISPSSALLTAPPHILQVTDDDK